MCPPKTEALIPPLSPSEKVRVCEWQTTAVHSGCSTCWSFVFDFSESRHNDGKISKRSGSLIAPYFYRGCDNCKFVLLSSGALACKQIFWKIQNFSWQPCFLECDVQFIDVLGKQQAVVAIYSSWNLASGWEVGATKLWYPAQPALVYLDYPVNVFSTTSSSTLEPGLGRSQLRYLDGMLVPGIMFTIFFLQGGDIHLGELTFGTGHECLWLAWWLQYSSCGVAIVTFGLVEQSCAGGVSTKDWSVDSPFVSERKSASVWVTDNCSAFRMFHLLKFCFWLFRKQTQRWKNKTLDFQASIHIGSGWEWRVFHSFLQLLPTTTPAATWSFITFFRSGQDLCFNLRLTLQPKTGCVQSPSKSDSVCVSGFGLKTMCFWCRDISKEHKIIPEISC